MCLFDDTYQTSQSLLFVSFESSKWEICVASEIVLIGPVDGALYQEMMLDFDGMRTIAQDKCVCVCVPVFESEK